MLKWLRAVQTAIAVLSALLALKGLLEFLEQDDYEGGVDYILNQPALADEVRALPAEVLAAIRIGGPILLRWIDQLIPEEKVLAATGG